MEPEGARGPVVSPTPPRGKELGEPGGNREGTGGGNRGGTGGEPPVGPAGLGGFRPRGRNGGGGSRVLEQRRAGAAWCWARVEVLKKNISKNLKIKKNISKNKRSRGCSRPIAGPPWALGSARRQRCLAPRCGSRAWAGGCGPSGEKNPNVLLFEVLPLG